MPSLKFLFLLVTIAAAFSVNGQVRNLTGTVKSFSGVLSGASVLLKGSTTGITTDNSGQFSLSVPAGRIVLIISLAGYETSEISVNGNQSNVEVNLAVLNRLLEEVVVTALGIQRSAKSLVYASQKIKASELTGVRDANNVVSSLQGK